MAFANVVIPAVFRRESRKTPYLRRTAWLIHMNKIASKSSCAEGHDSCHTRTGMVYAIFTLLIVMTAFIACGSDRIQTPLESTSDDLLTSYDEMMNFVGILQAETGRFSIDTIAVTAEDRSVIMLHFDAPVEEERQPDEKLKVFLYAQQHGDEPSGKEAALQLARDIASDDFGQILSSIDLYLVPQVNPDGSEKKQRNNANDIDLNRDHLLLTQPEVSGLHRAFRRIMPEVTLDIHEYGIAGEAWTAAGMHKNFGSQMGALSNPNMSINLRTFAWNSVFPFIEQHLRLSGINFQRYLVAGDPSKRFRFSTTALNDGRNSMGIYNTLSFILEGRKNETVEGNIHERTGRQLETIKAFLTFFSDNAVEVKRLVERERAEIVQGTLRPEAPIVMDYVKDPARPAVTVSVIDLASNQLADKRFENFYPLVRPSFSVLRPQGYAIPADLTDVVDVLRRHNINVNETEMDIRAAVEIYRITGVQLTEREDKDALDVDVEVTRSVMPIQEGYYIVWCNQVQINLIVTLLEAQSQWGLAPLPEFSSLLNVGANYPIIRIMRLLE
ncbi:M14 family zinc carboxypeptidase [candidate division KSB1 bacterium]